MKNIHLIPTDKPSRLSINTCFGNILELWDVIDIPKIKQDACIQDYNIYITNSEDIKEGWYFNTSKAINKAVFIKNEDVKNLKTIYGEKVSHLEKIILTTDTKLIEDGVQEVEDEFLEWFVKNPSCEYVEIDLFILDTDDIDEYYDSPDEYPHDYKTIIPKEEPNYNSKLEIEWISNNQQCKQIESCYNSLSKKCICPKEEPKKTYLHFFKNIDFGFGVKEHYTQTVYDKYQQEKDKMLYSEDEVKKLLIDCKNRFGGIDLDNYVEDSLVIKWFDKNKKK